MKHGSKQSMKSSILRIAIVSVILMAGAVASGGAAANAIDNSDDCEGTRVENGEMPPLFADVC